MANKKKKQPDKKVTPKTTMKKEKETKNIKEEKKVEIKKEKAISRKQQEKDIRMKKARKKTFVTSLLVTMILMVVTIASLFPLLKATKFGLDLQAGFEVLYKVKYSDGATPSGEDIEGTRKIIQKRIDILGVAEPEVRVEGDNIRVQLAGVTDEAVAKRTLSKMANLTFRDTSDNIVMDSSVLKTNGVKVAQDQENPGTYYLVLEIDDIDRFAQVSQEMYDKNEPLLTWLDFEEGVDSYQNTNSGLACGTTGDSRCISYATFKEGGIASNTVSLTGNFTKEEATELADLINSGGLSTQLEEISSRTVDASFGSDALQRTFLAGIVGVVAIIVLLICVYRFSGLITSVGILIYTAMVFLIFNLIGARLTLPSIAAVVIGIGMAVDASVITFSRIKEELRAKHTLEEAYKKGNKNSLSSIIDANITTLIAAFILYHFGEMSVKGFATMLIISIIVTLIVMVYFMRFLLGMFVKSGFFEGKYKAFLGIKDLNKQGLLEKINFKKWMPSLFNATMIILIAGSIFFGIKGFNLGVEFNGGTAITLNSSSSLKAEDVKADLESLGYNIDKVEVYNDSHVAYTTVNEALGNEDNEKIDALFAEKYEETSTNIASVSTEVKKELVENAIMSLIFACIGLIIYVSLRFTFSYGISAVFALLHDVLMVVIVFSVLRLEVSSIFIAAILSIIGYSINDTIVAFDRIRENKKKLYNNKIKSKAELRELINITQKEVIGRSLLTSITTLLPVIALIFLGSREILMFNYALLIGLVAGTYSSLFLALRVWYFFEKKNIGKSEKKKWYEVDDKDDIEELKVKGINC